HFPFRRPLKPHVGLNDRRKSICAEKSLCGSKARKCKFRDIQQVRPALERKRLVCRVRTCGRNFRAAVIASGEACAPVRYLLNQDSQNAVSLQTRYLPEDRYA